MAAAADALERDEAGGDQGKLPEVLIAKRGMIAAHEVGTALHLRSMPGETVGTTPKRHEFSCRLSGAGPVIIVMSFDVLH